MRLQFQTVDVFTGTQFAGNPLAVVLNAEGLSTAQMQGIAAEFNLAETTFVRPPQHATHTAEVRIFTPRYEMPFASSQYRHRIRAGPRRHLSRPCCRWRRCHL
jgi:trans-2,3-dihydro-3-hydroxyanthranilate isomerase